jgi:hypothetical protein
MKNKELIVLLPALLLAFGNVHAQDDEVPERYTYATYMYCDTSKEAAADAHVKENEVAVMDKLVDDGEILAWGWLRHHTGGKWRRIRYLQSDSLNGAVGAIGKMGEALEEALGDDAGGVGEACKGHEDYVWQLESGMAGVDRGKAGLSVYFTCNISYEDKADDIVAEHFAPIYNKLVEDGKITSWGWQSHVLGGSVRRLLTMTAKDFAAVLDARAAAIAAMPDEEDGPGAKFSKICGKHQDYLWDIVHETQAGS